MGSRLADDGRASHLARGLRLPSLALSSTVGNATDLSRLPGRSVIFCYPWTGRPGLPNPPNWDNIAGAHGSTPQAAGFRDRHAEFLQRGAKVFGLSTQDTPYQSELARRLDLPFGLLSDVDFVFQRALRMPVFVTGGITYLTRLTLIVREGAIEEVLYPVDPPEASATATLARLENL